MQPRENDGHRKPTKFPKTIHQHYPAQGQKESQKKETAKGCPGTDAAANFGRMHSVQPPRKTTSFRRGADHPDR